MINNDIEEKNSVDSTNENGDNEDSRVKQRDSARTKDSSVVDITKSDNTSKDIIDIDLDKLEYYSTTETYELTV